MKYANVILPLPLENLYTYKIPADLEQKVVPGCRVIVHFGKKHFYTAIVHSVTDNKPKTQYDFKEIFAILDAIPVLKRPQLRFWEWVASYYLCKLGDVYKAALPSGLKIESETNVIYHSDFISSSPLKPNECSVLDAFKGNDNQLTVSEIERRTGLHNIVPVLSSLIDLGAIEITERLKNGFSPKTETYIRIKEAWNTPGRMQEAFELTKRAHKQEQLLLAYLDLSHAGQSGARQDVSKKELLDKSGGNVSILNSLLKKGILEAYEKEVSRLQITPRRRQSLNPLSDAQLHAYREIAESFKQKDICLLHGVTSSGKTEIYVHLIDKVLKAGKQVLYLLPEIAITTQITERLGQLFGDKMLVYHSKFSDNERIEIWNKLLHDSSPFLILGVRSSLFLPFSNLGLVIVDEEHEVSYKQQDPAPRYNARNAAMVLANMHGGKVLLGSATPSIESYFYANNGKYGFVELSVRYGNCQAPQIIPINIREQKRKRIMKNPIFSPLLIEKMQQALEQNEQVILFQNRRGFAPMIECKECSWVPHCINCDVSMTYHKHQNRLVCHYCGYSLPFPEKCPECGSTDFQMLGFGTEKVEEEVKLLFPNYQSERMDLDTVRSKNAYERIIGNFEKGKTQILIGTQMVSKGLDFNHVGVVGILNADSLMNYPDFRAHERAFQLLVQVSGRAGQRDKRGTVLLQTSQPEHPLIQMVIHSAYKEMFDWQINERRMFRYPPFFRIIILVMRCKNEAPLVELSRLFADKLRAKLGERVLGPVTPPISYIQTYHIRRIVMKIESSASIQIMRSFLETTYEEMQKQSAFRQISMYYDVDPL